MKPEIEYLVVCDSVILDKDTGKASVIGIFQGLKIPEGYPSIAVPLTVFAKIRGVTGEMDASVSIFDPGGNQLGDSVKFMGKVDKGLQLRAIFALVNFTQSGIFKIKIAINNKELDWKEEHSIFVEK